MLPRSQFGLEPGHQLLVDILNKREESTRRKICKLINTFKIRLAALRDIKSRQHRQYFSQLLYSKFKQSVIDNYGEDVELKTFTLNILSASYRKHHRDQL